MEYKTQEFLLLIRLDVIKDIRNFIQGKHHSFLSNGFPFYFIDHLF